MAQLLLQGTPHTPKNVSLGTILHPRVPKILQRVTPCHHVCSKGSQNMQKLIPMAPFSPEGSPTILKKVIPLSPRLLHGPHKCSKSDPRGTIFSPRAPQHTQNNDPTARRPTTQSPLEEVGGMRQSLEIRRALQRANTGVSGGLLVKGHPLKVT